MARYRELRAKIDLPDNGVSRRELFDTLLEEQLLIFEAEQRGYDQDWEGCFQHERLQIQGLLDAFHRHFVSNGIAVDEHELRQLFTRLHTKIKARHLYAPTLAQADSLHAKLLLGKSFEELAEQGFDDPRLQDSRGALDYFGVDEMDPFFEEAAFTLNIGQISEPVRTAQGYSIVQVLDRVSKPLLTESEYARRRPQLEQYWRQRKGKIATRSYVDSLRRHLDVSFNRSAVAELWHLLKNRTPATAAEGFYLPHDERLMSQELVRSKLGVWQVRTFHEHAQFASAGQLRWVRSAEHLEDFIAGLVVRAHMLVRAKELGLHKSEEYRTTLAQKKDEYLLQRMEDAVSGGAAIPADSLNAYYLRHRHEFMVPPRIHLREMVLNSALEARAIEHQLQHHAAFDQLARAYSARTWSAENGGDIGAFTQRELGRYADRIFPLTIGRWVGPLKMNQQYAFFQCTGKDSGRAQSFGEARAEIEKTLKPIWRQRARQELLENLRQLVRVVTYPERLATIQIEGPDYPALQR